MDDKEVFNPQSGERIAPKKPKKFWKDWRFYVYTIIAALLAIVSVSSMVTACAAINAGVGQNESVSSEYKVKHNALSTTQNGGYDKYTFAVQNWLNGQALNTYNYRVFHVDYQTYTLTFARSSANISMDTNYYSIVNVINSTYEAQRPTTLNSLDFLIMEGYTEIPGNSQKWHWYYFTFMEEHNSGMPQMPFALFTDFAMDMISLESWTNSGARTDSFIVLNTDKSNSFLISYDSQPASGYTYQFQDLFSYLKEAGYNDGFEAGYSAGETAGNSAGYGQGYADGYDAGNTAGSNFTSITLSDPSPRYWLQFFDTDGLEHGGYTKYPLLDFVDNYGNTYSVVAYAYGEFNNPAYFFDVQVLRSVGGSTYILEAHIGSGTVEDPDSNPNVLPTRGVTFNIESARVTMVYNNSLQDNFFSIGWQTTDEFSYGAGYDAGLAVGRSQGANSVQPDSLTNTLVAVFQQPFNQIYRFFNFNILGINVLGIVTGLCSVLIILKVFRKLLK